MTDMQAQKHIALLEATLKEILRLESEASKSKTAITFDDVFDDTKVAHQWKDILNKARRLV